MRGGSGGRPRSGIERAIHRISNCASNSTTNSCYGAQPDTHIGELPNGFILRNFFGYVKASLLSIGIALLGTLGGLCLGINDHLLRCCLCIN